MSDQEEAKSGRKLPPAEFLFKKGQSGNRRGRPKGSISLKKMTRKVALRKYRTSPDGPAKPLLRLVVEALIRGAASGVSSLVVIHDDLRSKIVSSPEDQKGGLLLVPAPPASHDAFLAEMEAENAKRRDPSTYVNHKIEEFCKAARGEATPLGEALRAGVKRWGRFPE
jgi:hypothetical protein